MKHILFDIDGVIVHSDMWSNEYSRRTGIPTDIMKPFFQGDFQDCIAGKADLKDVVRPYLTTWKWSGTTGEYLEEWFRYENQVDRELLREIQKLRKSGIQCHVATNQEKYRLSYFMNEMGFRESFDSVFCSCEIGYKKPQREYYESILSSLDAKADEVLYFDDTEENVESARKLGINAILYRDISDLKISM